MKINLKNNKLAILISLMGAAILCIMLGAMGSLAADITLSKVKLGIIDQDHSSLSDDFKTYLATDLGYELVESEEFDFLSAELIDKHISVIIEIPEGFYGSFASGQIKELTITSLEDYENAAFLEAYLNSYLSSIHWLSDSAGGEPGRFDRLLLDYKSEHMKVTQTAASTVDRTIIKQREGFINSVGFYLMIVFGLGMFLAFMILEDRLNGVFKRIQITPVKPAQYILGSGLFGIFLCMIEVLIFCGFILVSGMKIGLPIWILGSNMLLFSLFTVLFSMALALGLRSKGALTAAIIGFCTVGAILGGAYFPLELAPKNLQNMARVLPQYWFMDTFRLLQADPRANYIPNFIILGLFTSLAFLLGAVLFTRNYKNS